jgi:hypothetical protein
MCEGDAEKRCGREMWEGMESDVVREMLQRDMLFHVEERCARELPGGRALSESEPSERDKWERHVH